MAIREEDTVYARLEGLELMARVYRDDAVGFGGLALTR